MEACSAAAAVVMWFVAVLLQQMPSGLVQVLRTWLAQQRHCLPGVGLEHPWRLCRLGP